MEKKQNDSSEERPTIIVDPIIDDIPNEPDPFWPEGATPRHLPLAERKDKSLVDTYVGALDGWMCEKCESTMDKSVADERYCNNCYKTEAKNTAMAKSVNAHWMEQSELVGLELFERQPEENDTEWLIWTTYRQHYPMRMPTWSELANECGVAVSTVIRAAQRWSFATRLQSWARFTDSDMMENRIAAIKEMNERQLDMAQRLQVKLSEAIDFVDPTSLRPNELVSLLKAATDLDRRITMALPEKVEGTIVQTQDKDVVATKPEDMSQIIQILQTTGILDSKSIGIEQTTTRFIAKEGD